MEKSGSGDGVRAGEGSRRFGVPGNGVEGSDCRDMFQSLKENRMKNCDYLNYFSVVPNYVWHPSNFVGISLFHSEIRSLTI